MGFSCAAKIDANTPAIHLEAIELLNDSPGTIDIFHGDKAETAGAVSARVVDNRDPFDRRNATKLVLDVLLGRADRETEYSDNGGRLDVARCMPRLGWWWWRTVAVAKKDKVRSRWSAIDS